MSTSFKSVARQQQSLLAPLEKRTLYWFAERMPASIGPDHLTLLGFGAMVAAGVFYYFSRTHPKALLAVIVCLAVNWFGDSLDGTLARYRQKQRRATVSMWITSSTCSVRYVCLGPDSRAI